MAADPLSQRRHIKAAVGGDELAALSPAARRRGLLFCLDEKTLAATPWPETPRPTLGRLVRFLAVCGTERLLLHEWAAFGHREESELCDFLWPHAKAVLEGEAR